jgi:hypothetical protein
MHTHLLHASSYESYPINIWEAQKDKEISSVVHCCRYGERSEITSWEGLGSLIISELKTV